MSSMKNNLDQLREAAPSLELVTDGDALTEKSHDWWVRGRLQRKAGEESRCAAVARPANTAEVSALLAWANETATQVVPFGLGSGVCGAVQTVGKEVVVDMTRMNQIVRINDESLTVTVQPGMRGCDFEAALAERGLTMNHFPQSIDLSTVGGWCATRASGQLSTRYGNIEDMLLGCEVVLPGGNVIRIPEKARAATGPDLKHLFMGSEGTLGIFTELTFRIAPVAEARVGRAYSLPSVEAGCESLRKIMRAGWSPTVTRLYDEVETGRSFTIATTGKPSLLLMSDGPQALVDAEMKACHDIVTAAGGEDQGEEPVDSWLDHRNSVPDIEELLGNGLALDTIEVAIGWDGLAPLFAKVCEGGMKLEGMIAFSGHVSHCYTQGANIYFTFVGTVADAKAGIELYDRAWEHTMTVTHELGGTIAHHHGIGRVRKNWLPKELGEAYQVLATLKRAIDPKGIMNPGALIDIDS
jgi:alkyldihydroxyacetonephosphate synthase